MAPILYFKTTFWSQKQPEATVPDFQSGYSVLHQKLGQSRVENEELISFFKERIAIEENYATKLTDQGKSNLKSTGFGRDEGASLVKCFLHLKDASRKLGEQHKATVSSLNTQVLVPLQEFHEEYKQNITNSKQAIDSMLKQFDGLNKEVEKSKYNYQRKCRDADKAEELALKNADMATNSTASNVTTVTSPTDTTNKTEEATETTETKTLPLSESNANMSNIQLGNQIMTRVEFDNLVRKMKQEINIGDHRVPILGTYKNTSTGEDIARWLQHNLPQCKDSPAMADIVGQQLIQAYHVLRLIGQRGNKFTASPNSFYQWRVMNEEDETASINSDTMAYATLGGLIDKISLPPSNPSEEPHKRARREAKRADELYRIAVFKLDQMRMAIEEAMFAHLTEMEQVELNRIQKLKQVISAFIAAFSIAVPQDKLVIEEMMVFQESLKPDQDIQFIIQQYAVSGFSPKAIVYDNYYHGIAHDQIFGVPLEELGRDSEDKVPKFISSLLGAIEKKIDKVEDKEKCWCTPIALDRVHSTCLELNKKSDEPTVEMFDKYEPDLLVAVLRYLLLELPECLLTYEVYDPVNTLLSGNQEDSLLQTSISNLIATLPASHFATLKLLFSILTNFIKKTSASPEITQNICQSIGPVILRSKVESFTVLNSKIPVRFANKLVKNYNSIFSESTLKLHAESEKRRNAKPIVAPEQEQQQPQQSQQPKRGNSLMSFMRPTINTASMIGVFQRNSSVSETPTATQAKVSLSFGSIITQQESPPSSPSVQHVEPKVVFDNGDLFDDKKQDEEQQKEKPSTTHMDSSFFDDDEDD